MNQSITRTLSVAAAALTLCMATGGAFAQDRRDDRGPHRFQQQQPQYHQGPGARHDPRGGAGYRGNNGYRGDRQDFRPGREMDRRGFPNPHAEWRRGGRVPSEYRGRNYVVDDYRMHRLNPPPRGYQWVGVGGDFVLAAVATGIIAQIIAGQ
ncbi:RcnB family protein [Variovorax sp. PAMC 28711]|uniref:RcnB family protein n=1 Tax=Variovorax sp. PAMC 28711 TaxID=1795631 RepID=UPI00078E3414|nr:RcnB family protein [Variovorax sp. PAMC 28711]AMM24680.1 hypothetical protein AX767_10210 [Variovorax sp. PAMC 28711]